MRLRRRLVPDLLRPRTTELIIRLCIVRAVIPHLAERLGKRLQPLRQRCVATHVLGSDRVLVHARNDPRPARSTDPRGGVGVGVSHPLRCERIKVRGDRIRIAIGTELRADILRRDPKDVRFLLRQTRGDRKGNREEEATEQTHPPRFAFSKREGKRGEVGGSREFASSTQLHSFRIRGDLRSFMLG